MEARKVGRMKAREFLEKFHERLSDEAWGTIESRWFDPDYEFDDDGISSPPCEEDEWVVALHQIIEDIFEGKGQSNET